MAERIKTWPYNHLTQLNMKTVKICFIALSLFAFTISFSGCQQDEVRPTDPITMAAKGGDETEAGGGGRSTYSQYYSRRN